MAFGNVIIVCDVSEWWGAREIDQCTEELQQASNEGRKGKDPHSSLPETTRLKHNPCRVHAYQHNSSLSLGEQTAEHSYGEVAQWESLESSQGKAVIDLENIQNEAAKKSEWARNTCKLLYDATGHDWKDEEIKQEGIVQEHVWKLENGLAQARYHMLREKSRDVLIEYKVCIKKREPEERKESQE